MQVARKKNAYYHLRCFNCKQYVKKAFRKIVCNIIERKVIGTRKSVFSEKILHDFLPTFFYVNLIIVDAKQFLVLSLLAQL